MSVDFLLTINRGNSLGFILPCFRLSLQDVKGESASPEQGFFYGVDNAKR